VAVEPFVRLLFYVPLGLFKIAIVRWVIGGCGWVLRNRFMNWASPTVLS